MNDWSRACRLLLAVLLGAVQPTRAQPAPAVPAAAETGRILRLLNADNAAALRASRQLLAQAEAARPDAADPATRQARLADAHWLLGAALRNEGRFDSSLYHGQRALSGYLALGQPSGQANAYTLLAQTYKRLADAQHVTLLTRKALSLAGLAVAVARRGPDSLGLARACLVQGIIYRDLKDYAAARRCYERAIGLARRDPGQPSPLPVAYANLGQLRMDADHDLPGAIGLFRRALPLYRAEGNRNGQEHAYRQLSWAYRQAGQPARAVGAADTCLALGRASTDPHRLLNSLEAAYLAYRAAGRLPQALALLEEFKTRTDALTSADIAQAVAARQATFELGQQAARITDLDAANARQRRRLLGLGLGAGLLLVLLGLAAWQYQALRRANARLAASKQLIEVQAERLGLLLREVHHRVKNNLATVAGLLQLQASRLPDEQAARAVRESQQRVEAMSLIHQGLYQADDVTSVDLAAYVRDLFESLRQAYAFPPENLDLVLDLHPVRLDIEQAVPLGLLLNELLTNAFKHALPHPPPGQRPALRLALHPAPAGGLSLEVQDNGPGFAADSIRVGAFGQRLVAALTRQLGGRLQVGAAEGTWYRLEVG